MSEFRPGDVVDVTIRSARVTSVESNVLNYSTVAGGKPVEHMVHFGPGWPGVEIKRTAPPEWPPRPADVWRDRNGTHWFAILLTLPRKHIELHPDDPTGNLVGLAPDDVLARVGPLELAFRPTPGEEWLNTYGSTE